MSVGYDKELPITEVTEDEITNFRRGLFNAAKHLGVSLHCRATRQSDGTWTVLYAVHDKNTGKAYVMATHGEDRTRWPYNPRRRTPKESS